MNNQDKIDRIDEVLAQCEDILHGDIGEGVTEARKSLGKLASDVDLANVSDCSCSLEDSCIDYNRSRVICGNCGGEMPNNR